ncbi:MAG: aminotransferase class V-fold PLP-dependent enzyme [bacterium]|nr:aminotransferase class V-fold PLP-dependent enzyme [bacterium]
MKSKSEIEKKFQAARRLFPHTKKVTYFNAASYGPFSTLVQRAIEDNVKLRLHVTRDDSHDAFETADQLRSTFAKFIGARMKEVGVGLNTTMGLNIAAFGLPLKKGDEILLSDVEFPAAVYTWRAAAETRGLKLKMVPSTDRKFDIEKLNQAITKKSRVLCISYVQFFNGYKNDLKVLAEICKKHNLYFVVDGIQGMGVEPINVRKLGIDIFSSGCQKWMLSPQGCGFFYLSEKIQKQLSPPFMSWLGVDWKVQFTDLFRFDLPYFESARKYEMGYYVVQNLLAMKASATIFSDLGIGNIKKHNYELIDRLADYISGNKFYRITSSMEPRHRSSIFTFTCPGYKELHRMLLKERVILVQREGSIRVSVHLYNNQADVDRLIGLLESFSAKSKAAGGAA